MPRLPGRTAASKRDDMVTVNMGARLLPERVVQIRRIAEQRKCSVASVVGEFIECGIKHMEQAHD